MAHGMYCIISEITEDRFDETDSEADALQIAYDLVREGQAGDPISIEHDGKVILQLVLTDEGNVERNGQVETMRKFDEMRRRLSTVR